MLCPESNAAGTICVSAQKALYTNIHASFEQVKALQLWHESRVWEDFWQKDWQLSTGPSWFVEISWLCIVAEVTLTLEGIVG